MVTPWMIVVSRPCTMSPMKRVLVIGATGHIGREVVSALDPSQTSIRAFVRNPAGAQLPPSVEIVEGDLTAPDTIDRAMDGIDAAFLLWTAPASAAAAAIERLVRGVKRIVLLSSPHQTPHPFFQQPNPMAAFHAELDRAVASGAEEWTILRPGMFALNCVAWWAAQIRAGNVVRWPYADAATAPIHERDIAEVAVRALLDDGHDRGDYVITGPESLTQREQVAILGEVLNRPLRYEELSRDDAKRELGAPPPVIEMLLNAWDAATGLPAYVTSHVAEVTGKNARTFRDWAIDHAADFGGRHEGAVT